MGNWTDTFNDIFFISIGTTVVVPIVIMLIKYSFKSKCDSVNLCCGLIKIHRAVELEHSDEEKEPKSKETEVTPSSSKDDPK
jgi:hypothetical protein